MPRLKVPSQDFFLRRESFGGLLCSIKHSSVYILNSTGYDILSYIINGHESFEDKDLIEYLHSRYPNIELNRIKYDINIFLYQLSQEGFIEIENARQEHINRIKESSSPEFRGILGVEPYVLSAPLSVLMELTYRCNLRCMHCFSSSPRITEELNTEDWFSVIDELSVMNVPNVFLSGGEPLLREDFFDIARYLKAKNIGACLLTNGTLLTRDLVRTIKEDTSIFKIELNLDSHIPEIYDMFRGIKGAFERSLEAIKLCLEEGISFRVNVTVTKLNINHLQEIASYAIELGIPEIVFVPLRPAGNALSAKTALEVDPTTYYNALSELHRFRETLAPDKRSAIVSEFDRNMMKYINPAGMMPACGAGRLHCTITPQGNVKLCPTFPDNLIAGNVMRESLRKIWTESEVFRKVRNPLSLPPQCVSCPEIGCFGGCLIRGMNAHGKLLGGPDPYCPRLLHITGG
jgi:radical SAM protein with 4Fe4S-binding SPASM domain